MTDTIMNKSWNDPQTYRECSEPFDNLEGARLALDEFLAKVAKLRKEHGIPDLHLIARMNVLDETDKDGTSEGVSYVSAHLGSSLEAPLMCAYALGKERQLNESMLARALKGQK